MANVAAYFDRSGWPADELEPGLWHSAFEVPTGDLYHLYVLESDDWLHFAVSPILHCELPAAAERLCVAALGMNQDLRQVRLALDADGDINLLADLLTAHVTAATFGETLELLVYYTNHVAPQLRRLAAEPQHQSHSVE